MRVVDPRFEILLVPKELDVTPVPGVRDHVTAKEALLLHRRIWTDCLPVSVPRHAGRRIGQLCGERDYFAWSAERLPKPPKHHEVGVKLYALKRRSGYAG